MLSWCSDVSYRTGGVKRNKKSFERELSSSTFLIHLDFIIHPHSIRYDAIPDRLGSMRIDAPLPTKESNTNLQTFPFSFKSYYETATQYHHRRGVLS